MKPLFSMIVPVYNCQNTLDRCLNSIRNQTESNLEILVVDDGSTDNSLHLIEKHSIEDKRIKVLKQKNMGVSAARNRALKTVSGSYISFLDADDYIDKNYIKELYQAICKFDADISLCSCIKETEDGQTILNKRKIRNTVPYAFSVKKGYSYVYETAQEVIWGALYKREILKDIEFQTDLYVGEDALFFAEVSKKCRKMVHTYLKLYHCVIRPSSASRGAFTEKKYTQIEAWERLCNLFTDHPDVFCSAKCAYAIRCYLMIKNYYSDENFKKGFYREVIHKYRKNIKWFYISKETSFPKKIFRTMFAVCPVLFIKNSR